MGRQINRNQGKGTTKRGSRKKKNHSEGKAVKRKGRGAKTILSPPYNRQEGVEKRGKSWFSETYFGCEKGEIKIKGTKDEKVKGRSGGIT